MARIDRKSVFFSASMQWSFAGVVTSILGSILTLNGTKTDLFTLSLLFSCVSILLTTRRMNRTRREAERELLAFRFLYFVELKDKPHFPPRDLFRESEELFLFCLPKKKQEYYRQSTPSDNPSDYPDDAKRRAAEILNCHKLTP